MRAKTIDFAMIFILQFESLICCEAYLSPSRKDGNQAVHVPEGTLQAVYLMEF